MEIVGQRMTLETLVEVRWSLLTFITSRILLSFTLLVFTIIQTEKPGMGIANSNFLQVFLTIKSCGTGDSDSGPTLRGQQEVD
jgi:hypothetical protein